MPQFLVKIKTSTDELLCSAMNSGVSGLGLDEAGITWLNDVAPVRIEVTHEELFVVKSCSFAGHASIIRAGRERELASEQAIRLLAKDEICLNDIRFTVQTVIKGCSNRFEKAFSSLRTASRALMLTTAAALALTACSPNGNQDVKADALTGAKAVVEVPSDEQNVKTGAEGEKQAVAPAHLDANAHPGQAHHHEVDPAHLDANAHPGQAHHHEVDPAHVDANAHPGQAHHHEVDPAHVDVNAHPGRAVEPDSNESQIDNSKEDVKEEKDKVVRPAVSGEMKSAPKTNE